MYFDFNAMHYRLYCIVLIAVVMIMFVHKYSVAESELLLLK